jgi:hypothetical protein
VPLILAARVYAGQTPTYEFKGRRRGDVQGGYHQTTRAIAAETTVRSRRARAGDEVLDYFQEGGPGWQDRINEALRKIAGK